MAPSPRVGKRAGKAVPAAVIAATLAAGAAAYATMTTGGAARDGLTAAMVKPPAASLMISSSADSAQAAPSPARATESAFFSALTANMSAGRQAIGSVARRVQAKKAAATRKPSARATAGPAAKASPAATLSCGAGSGTLPANATAIVSFLLAHGYSRNAAAGIAGNIYRESMGNPESVGTGGGGLIGWTPLPSGFVTGNPAADLQTQLAAVLTFNRGWAQYIPALNAASSPAAAADIYVTDFERAGIPAAGQREASAEAVASACGL